MLKRNSDLFVLSKRVGAASSKPKHRNVSQCTLELSPA